MINKEKAEAYVRSQIPELIADCGNVHPQFDVSHPQGHPLEIHLQHWLRMLEAKLVVKMIKMAVSKTEAYSDIGGLRFMHFNLTTGQPATEADYQAFNDIVGM